MHPEPIVLESRFQSRNQFFYDVNLDHITPQIPEGEQDMSERQNGIQRMSAQCSPI